MALNRGGKLEMGTIVIIGIILVVAYGANFGGLKDKFDGFLGGSGSDSGSGSGSDSGTDAALAKCPTDGTTTYTLNIQDALTSSATDVTAEYYVFGDNKLIKSGTISGSGTFDVACGKDYDVLLVNTTANTGAYGKTVKIQARESEDTVNEKLVRVGGAIIVGIQNPSDPLGNANVSLSAGGVKPFNLLFRANTTEKGYNNPMILCQVNISSINSVAISSFSDGTPVETVAVLPKRLTASAGYQYYAWVYPKMLDPSKGVVTASGSITALASVTPATTDAMTCLMADQATWTTSNYKTAANIAEAFKVGVENTETLANVGAPDTTTSAYNFVSAGGY